MPVRLFVVAGEASGDRHLGGLLDALERRLGPLEVRGLGGESLRRRGVKPLADPGDLDVLGFTAVLGRLPFFRRLLNRCLDEIRTFAPQAVILVDYPGFNLRLARRVRRLGVPVLYYIAPQVWAWRRDRRPGIARAVDRLLVVFPFEEPLFRAAGISTAFVGHPLLDAPPADPPRVDLRRRLGVTEGDSLLAVLPGSRAQEVGAILPPLVAGTEALRGEGVRVAVSRTPRLGRKPYEAATERGCALWEGSAAALVAGADAALVASGTATLETGLRGTPLAVVYRTGWLNWHLARLLVRIRTVGLVNIAAGGTRVPELLQGDLTPEAVERIARRLLFDATERREQSDYLAGLSDRLGGSGAVERAADEVAAFLEEARDPAL